jgi:hypothetical protein
MQATKIVLTSSGTVELGGNTLQLTASLFDKCGNSVEPSESFTWQSSNPGLLSVDDTGLCTSAAIQDPNALQTGGAVQVECSYPYQVNEKIYATASIQVTVPAVYSGVVVGLDNRGTLTAYFGDTKVFPVQPWPGQPIIGG